MAVHRLVYVSTTAPGLDQPSLDAILDAARRNNAEMGITGFLLSLDGHFMQLLEGPKAAVESTYQAICADSRHSNPGVVLQTDGETRCFPDWRMGCHVARQVRPQADMKQQTSTGVAGALPVSVTPDVRALFLGFRGSPGVSIGVQ